MPQSNPQRILVLFNLKEGKSAEDYERWAREVDMPGVNGLESVDDFRVFRGGRTLFADEDPPYRYVEILDVNDMDRFGEEAGQDHMKAIAEEFQTTIAADLVFIPLEAL